MRLLAILIATLCRLAIWPFLWLLWFVRAVAAAGDLLFGLLFYMPRLLVGLVLWLAGSRLFLAVPALMFIVPLMQGVNVPPGPFYGIVGGSLLLFFCARKLAPIILPKARHFPRLVLPALPSFPSWPPFPAKKPRQRRVPVSVREIIRTVPAAAPIIQKVVLEPSTPVRPAASAVNVVAAKSIVRPTVEQDTIAQLSPALQQLIQRPAVPEAQRPRTDGEGDRALSSSIR